MPRILHLVGLSFAAAAAAGANCTAGVGGTNIGATCTSCVTTGGVSVCSAAYSAVLLPTCPTISCTSPANPWCPSTPPATALTCNICTGVTALPVCLSTSSSVGFALASQAGLDFAGANVDLNVFSGSSTTVTTIDDKATNNGTVAAASAVVTLSSAAIANVNVGAATSSSVAIFEVNSGTTTVTAWNNNAAAAKVDNSATLTINSLVTGNSFFSVWHNASAAASASVTFNSIDFSARGSFGNTYGSGVVHVSGGSVKVNASGIKGTGTLKLTGGASASTSASTSAASVSIPATITIDITAQGTSGPIAVVEKDTVLDVSGDITSDSDKGVVAVNGQLRLGSTARATTQQVRPKVIVNSGATVAINAASAFHATAVSVTSGATLQFNASTQQQAAAQAGTVVIDKIDLVAGSIVEIKLATSASIFASSMANGAVAFNYSASSNTVADLARSTVRVVDSTGAVVTLTSTTSASASTGRRLLASSNTATWGSNGMSYQMTGQSSGALPSCIVMPALVMSFLSLLL